MKVLIVDKQRFCSSVLYRIYWKRFIPYEVLLPENFMPLHLMAILLFLPP